MAQTFRQAKVKILVLLGVTGLSATAMVFGVRALKLLLPPPTVQQLAKLEATALQSRFKAHYRSRLVLASTGLSSDGPNTVISYVADMRDPGHLATANFMSICHPLPANHGLDSGQQQSLADLAPCLPCPAGEYASVHYSDDEHDLEEDYPKAPLSPAGLVATALCVEASSDQVDATVYSGILLPSKPLLKLVSHLVL